MKIGNATAVILLDCAAKHFEESGESHAATDVRHLIQEIKEGRKDAGVLKGK